MKHKENLIVFVLMRTVTAFLINVSGGLALLLLVIKDSTVFLVTAAFALVTFLLSSLVDLVALEVKGGV